MIVNTYLPETDPGARPPRDLRELGCLEVVQVGDRLRLFAVVHVELASPGYLIDVRDVTREVINALRQDTFGPEGVAR